MSGSTPPRGLGFGAMPDHPFQTLQGVPRRPSCTPSCRPQDRLRTTNKKSGRPDQRSAATSIAAAGMLPEPREREAVILSQAGSLVKRADRMARYKVIRHRGAARSVCGDHSERDARLRHVEGSDVPYAMSDRTRSAASQPARAVRVRPRLKQRVEKSPRGERPAERSAGPGACWRAGLRSSRGSPHTPDRSPTDRPDSRDFGPTARPREGLLMMAMPHRHEATWRELDGLISARLFASARSSIALSS